MQHRPGEIKEKTNQVRRISTADDKEHDAKLNRGETVTPQSRPAIATYMIRGKRGPGAKDKSENIQ
jgi:hypothetical protein